MNRNTAIAIFVAALLVLVAIAMRMSPSQIGDSDAAHSIPSSATLSQMDLSPGSHEAAAMTQEMSDLASAEEVLIGASVANTTERPRDTRAEDAILEAAASLILDSAPESQRTWVYYGSVRDESGQPIVGANLLIRPAQSPVSHGSPTWTTNSQGMYTIVRTHGSGHQHLVASAEGYATEWTPLEAPTPSAGRSRHDFVLKRGIVIAGQVIDSESKQGLGNLPVQLRSVEDRSTTLHENTNANGQFSFGVHGEAEYEISIRPRHHEAINPIRTGETEDLVIELSPAKGSISGRVVDARSGRTLPEMRVTAQSSGGPATHLTAATGEGGRFVIERAPAGSYTLSASPMRGGGAGRAESVTAIVERGSESGGHVLEYNDKRLITVTVIHNETEEPVSGVRFRTQSWEPSRPGEEYTSDSRGVFVVESSPGNSHHNLEIIGHDFIGQLERENYHQPAGLQIRLQSPQNESGQHTTDDYEATIRLFPLRPVDVLAIDGEGRRLEKVRVGIQELLRGGSSVWEDSPFADVTNHEGRARILAPAIRGTRISGTLEYHSPAQASVPRFSEDPAEIPEVTLRLVPMDTIEVTGIVVDHEGAPIEGAEVLDRDYSSIHFQPTGNRMSPSAPLAISAADGSFAFTYYHHSGNINATIHFLAFVDVHYLSHTAEVVPERGRADGIRLIVDTRQNRLAGRVVDEEDNPMEGFHVVAALQTNARHWGSDLDNSSETDETGAFALPRLLPGNRFRLSVMSEQIRDGQTTRTSFHSETITEDFENILLRVRRPDEETDDSDKLTMFLFFYDAHTGEPINNPKSDHLANWFEPIEGVSNGLKMERHFQIRTSHSFRFSAPGYPQHQITISPNDVVDNLVERDVRMTPARPLFVRLSDQESGEPIKNANLSTGSQSTITIHTIGDPFAMPHEQLTAQSDAEGLARLKGIRSNVATLNLKINAPEPYGVQEKLIHLEPEPDHVHEVTLAPAAKASILVLQLPGETPVPGLVVNVNGTSRVTDNDGVLTWPSESAPGTMVQFELPDRRLSFSRSFDGGNDSQPIILLGSNTLRVRAESTRDLPSQVHFFRTSDSAQYSLRTTLQPVHPDAGASEGWREISNIPAGNWYINLPDNMLKSFHLKEEGVTEFVLTLDPAKLFELLVVNEEGQPLGDVWVSLAAREPSEDRVTYRANTHSDQKGIVRINAPEGETVHIAASVTTSDGPLRGTMDWTFREGAAPPTLVLSDQDTLDPVMLIVTEEGTGRGVGSVLLRIHDGALGRGIPTQEAPGNVRGTYLVRGLESGPQRLIATATGFAGLPFDVVVPDNRDGFMMETTLRRQAIASVTVQSTDGSPARQATVRLVPTDPENTSQPPTRTTDGIGNVRLDGLWPGAYRVVATGTDETTGEQEVQLAPGETSRVVITLEP